MPVPTAVPRGWRCLTARAVGAADNLEAMARAGVLGGVLALISQQRGPKRDTRAEADAASALANLLRGACVR